MRCGNKEQLMRGPGHRCAGPFPPSAALLIRHSLQWFDRRAFALAALLMAPLSAAFAQNVPLQGDGRSYYSTQLPDVGAARRQGRDALPDTRAGPDAARGPDQISPAVESRPEAAVAPDRQPEVLYLDAMSALAAGRTEEAQSLFEAVIAKRPDDELAAKARRQLGQIYSLNYPANDQPAAQPSPTSLEEAPSPLSPVGPEPRATGSPIAAPAVPQPWRSSATRTERFEALMRAEVGDRIFFSLESDEIGTRARSVVLRQAKWLARFPEVFVVVEGHSDDPGDTRRNEALSIARAGRVRELLIAGGMPAGRIDVAAFGQQQKIADCASPVCAAQNRRAVTRLYVRLPRSDSAGSLEPSAASRQR